MGMDSKKNAAEFVADMLSGNIKISIDPVDKQSMQDALAKIAELYDFTSEQLQEELLKSRCEIENVIGVPITDEQLIAISGGKLSKTNSIIVGNAAAVAGVTGGALAAFAIISLIK